MVWYWYGTILNYQDLCSRDLRSWDLSSQNMKFSSNVLNFENLRCASSGPVVPGLKVLYILKTSVVHHPPCSEHICVKVVSIVSLFVCCYTSENLNTFSFLKILWKLASFSLPLHWEISFPFLFLSWNTRVKERIFRPCFKSWNRHPFQHWWMRSFPLVVSSMCLIETLHWDLISWLFQRNRLLQICQDLWPQMMKSMCHPATLQ